VIHTGCVCLSVVSQDLIHQDQVVGCSEKLVWDFYTYQLVDVFEIRHTCREHVTQQKWQDFTPGTRVQNHFLFGDETYPKPLTGLSFPANTPWQLLFLPGKRPPARLGLWLRWLSALARPGPEFNPQYCALPLRHSLVLLASNHDPSNLHLPNCWDYRGEPPRQASPHPQVLWHEPRASIRLDLSNTELQPQPKCSDTYICSWR
jgi:hypothetical protein